MINLRGWPRPAGWNSGRPVGSVVLIYPALALQMIHSFNWNELKGSVFLSRLPLLSHPLTHTDFAGWALCPAQDPSVLTSG